LLVMLQSGLGSCPSTRLNPAPLSSLFYPLSLCRRTASIIGDTSNILASAPIVGGGGQLGLIGGRKMLAARSLQGTDGDGIPVVIDTTQNTYSKIGKYCSNDNNVWGTITNYNATLYSVYGDLVHDASICKISANGKGKVVTSNNAAGLVSLAQYGPAQCEYAPQGRCILTVG
jgi:hypothetical protein